MTEVTEVIVDIVDLVECLDARVKSLEDKVFAKTQGGPWVEYRILPGDPWLPTHCHTIEAWTKAAGAEKVLTGWDVYLDGRTVTVDLRVVD
ncbi:MAG: hypothetical protein V3W44_09675 [Dehalococcoidales bacterium]